MKRKGDDDDDGGWGGGKRGGGGGGGGWGGKAGKAFSGKGGFGQEPRRGKALKSGSYGEVAGRTFAVFEVRVPDLLWWGSYIIRTCTTFLIYEAFKVARGAVRCPG